MELKRIDGSDGYGGACWKGPGSDKEEEVLTGLRGGEGPVLEYGVAVGPDALYICSENETCSVSRPGRDV